MSHFSLDKYYGEEVSLEKLEQEAKTGDLLLFYGSHALSKLIGFMEQMPLSHIAMVWRVEQEHVELLPLDTPHLLESDYTEREGFVLGKKHGGVQVARSLLTRIKQYEGKIWWKPLLRCEDRVERSRTLKYYLSKNCGVPYNIDPWCWLASGLREFRDDTDAQLPEGFHCIALVASALRAMGVFHKEGFSPHNVQFVDIVLSERLKMLISDNEKFVYSPHLHLVWDG